MDCISHNFLCAEHTPVPLAKVILYRSNAIGYVLSYLLLEVLNDIL